MTMSYVRSEGYMNMKSDESQAVFYDFIPFKRSKTRNNNSNRNCVIFILILFK